MKIKLLLFALFFSVLSWGQVNITQTRTDVSGFSSWTDTNLTGTTLLTLINSASSILSPSMDFSLYTAQTLDFKARTFNGVNAPNNIITVSISLNNGGSWAVLGTRTPTSNNLATVTQFDLSTYNNSQFKIKIESLGASGTIGVGIDDIDIKGLLTPTVAPTLTSSNANITVQYGASFGNYTITADKSPTSYSATGLPTGMSVNTTTGVISGTSTQVGTFPVSITATNIIGTSTAVIKNYIINPKPLTISGLSSTNKVYDGTTTAILTGTAMLSGIVSTDVVTLGGTPVSNFSQSNVGTSLTITTTGYTLSGADVAKYTFTQPTVTGRSITKKPLTITGITANNKAYDTTTVATLSGTATLVGVVGADIVTLNGTPVASFASATVANTKPVTVTGYTISGAQSGNYSITQPTGLTANIIKATPIIIFGALSDQALSGNTFTINATSSSPVAINYASSNLAVATVVPATGVVTMLSVGSTIFTASQIANTSYTAAADVTQNQNIITGLPEIRVEKASNSNIPSGSSPNTGFDTQFAMQTIGNFQTKTYNIRNIGGATLNVSAITLVGINPGDFEINATTPFAISPPSGFVTFTVTFRPIGLGNRIATISIANNDSDENPFTFDVQGTGNCPTTTITATPTSGPVGTQVTITSTNSILNNLLGATATFGGIAATVLSTSATQIVVVIPVGAGNSLSTTNTLGCTATLTYSIIKEDKTSCEGAGGNFNDLIISEVYDSQALNVWHMELFNPTLSPINLATSNYTIKRFGDVGNVSPSRTITLTGIVNAGATFYMQLGDSGTPCSGPYDFTQTGPGINSNDEIRLTKNGVDVDVVYCPIDTDPDLGIETVGYSIRRNSLTSGPTMSYNIANWTVFLTENCSDLNSFSNISRIAPTVSTQPAFSSLCGVNTATLTTLGTEGFASGNGLEYVWYQVAPNTSLWSVVDISNNFADTDGNSATLNIANISGLNNYQFYCQIRENTATCFVATVAVIIKDATISTWNGTSWEGGAPDLNKLAIIDGAYIAGSLGHGNFSCCTLTVNSGFGKSLTITANGYVEVQNEVNNNGIINIENNASLIQINNSATNSGSGTTNVTRTTPNFDKYDYTYWSSPIKDDNIGTRLSAWNQDYMFNFITENFSDTSNDATYPQTNGLGADNFDDNNNDWVKIASPTATTMSPGVGYAVMGGTTGAFPRTETVTFSGVVNNGIIPFSLKQSANTVELLDDYNLVGNPYPSSIKADDFINANISPTPNITGTLYFWTHGGSLQPAATNPGPNINNYNANEYALYNLTGSTVTATAAGPTGSPISAVPNGFIGTGQAFLVEAVTTNDLIFNNSMRNKNHNNSQFFRRNKDVQKDRLWLNFANIDQMFSQQLIGYLPETTLDFDYGYDGIESKSQNFVSFYSFTNQPDGINFKIQSRNLFNQNDEVKLGFFSAVSGQSSIAIDHFEGEFNNQNIFLQDNLLNIIHDLKQSAYSFTTNYGMFNDRFVLKYINTFLANDTFVNAENAVLISTKDSKILVASNKEKIKSVQVFDLLGRNIYDNQSVNTKSIATDNLAIKNQVLIVKTKLENGEVVTKKIML